jgi:hypothetical protein
VARTETSDPRVSSGPVVFRHVVGRRVRLITGNGNYAVAKMMGDRSIGVARADDY